MSAIRIKYPALTIKAGSRALARIRARGLQPADVGILPGAAGGAKALGIQGLDLALFGDWLPRNMLGRPRLARHFERLILHDARLAPPLAELNDFPSRYLALYSANLRHALLASGSIPMIMQGVRDIPGAGPGTYRDGGLLDYHLDLPYSGDDIVLYPHFTEKIIPG